VLSSPPAAEAGPVMDFQVLGAPAKQLPALNFCLISPAIAAAAPDQRPVVWFYPAPPDMQCKPCELLKEIAARDAKTRELPFRLLEGKTPANQPSFPWLHWNNAEGKGMHQEWPGSLGAFLESWRATQLKGLAKQRPAGHRSGA
jgi:hypothetical protein